MRKEKREKITVIYFEPEPFFTLHSGKPPKWQFSHNKFLLAIAENALERGIRVFVSTSHTNEFQEITKLWPEAEFSGDLQNLPSLERFECVFFSTNIWQFAWLKTFDSDATCVWVLSAVHWLEMADVFPNYYLDQMRESLVNELDFVLTQNRAMKDQILALTGLVAKWTYDKRVLTCLVPPVPPISLKSEMGFNGRDSSKQKLGFSPDARLIVNAGGAWDWTDLETFLVAFSEYIRVNEGTQLCFLQLGIRQPDNTDHASSEHFIRAFMDKNKDLLDKGSIRIVENWSEASGLLTDALQAADFGLNVSKPTIEAHQSMRQRYLDYLGAGIPVINTYGDSISFPPLADSAFFVMGNDVESYKDCFTKLDKGGEFLSARQQAAKRNAINYLNSKDLGLALETIEGLGPLDEASRKSLINNYPDVKRTASPPSGAKSWLVNKINQFFPRTVVVLVRRIILWK